MIRDQLKFEKNPSFLQTKCFVCGSKSHMVKYCPLLHYVPNRIKVVRQYIRDPGQNFRECFERFRTKSNRFNSLFSLKYVQSCNLTFRTYSNVFNGLEGSIIFDNEALHEKPKNRLKINTNVEKNLESPSRVPKLGERLDSGEDFDVGEGEEEVELSENIQDVEESPRKVTGGEEGIKIKNGVPLDISFRKSIYPTRDSIFRLQRQSVVPSILKLFPVDNPISKIITFESDNSINENINQIQSKRLSLNEVPEYKDEEKPSDGNLFETHFEKGCNFKNYYPKANLSKILEFNSLIRKINQEKLCQSKKTPMANHHRRTKPLKTNRILPLQTLEDKTPTYRQIDSIIPNQSNNKKLSSIYCRTEKKFNNMKNLTFYDIVTEVLHNQELRKKLQSLKIKSKKKRTQF